MNFGKSPNVPLWAVTLLTFYIVERNKDIAGDLTIKTSSALLLKHVKEAELLINS